MSKFKDTAERRKGEAAHLEMTPMIDVVFQLLIFFIVTLKQQDILANLNVSRPAPEERPPDTEVEELLTIQVYNERRLGGEGFVLNGRQVTLASLERRLMRFAKYDKEMSVIIKCTADSPHSNLVRLLDRCTKAGLRNLSVFSM